MAKRSPDILNAGQRVVERLVAVRRASGVARRKAGSLVGRVVDRLVDLDAPGGHAEDGPGALWARSGDRPTAVGSFTQHGRLPAVHFPAVYARFSPCKVVYATIQSAGTLNTWTLRCRCRAG